MNTFSDGLHEDSQVHAFEYPVVGVSLDSVEQAECGNEGRMEEAHQQGVREGELQAKQQFEQILQRERAAIVEEINKFGIERERYYRQVETEVVQLALSIAKKVLHREAQVDPLLLAGIVRVALRNMEAGTRVKVKVNPQDVPTWSRVLNEIDNVSAICEVKPEPAIAKDRCVLETELGTTELGIDLQLKEIENGLFDLLAKRPQVTG